MQTMSSPTLLTDIPLSSDNRLSTPLAEHFQALPKDWSEALAKRLPATVINQLCQTIDQRLAQGAVIYPQYPLRALHLTPLSAVKVVILGQDPYHGAGQAQGLAFSVPPGLPLPPSLRNILLELEADIGRGRGKHRISPPQGDLEDWAQQGVLLLNTVLTVEANTPQAHATLGWERVTDALLLAVAEREQPAVFLLWGASAQKKAGAIDEWHAVFKANHPSPLSARRGPVPFLGCRHFSQTNAFLKHEGQAEIQW